MVFVPLSYPMSKFIRTYSEVVSFGTAATISQPTLDRDFVKYVRITNKGTGTVNMVVATDEDDATPDETADAGFTYQLSGGESFIFHKTKSSIDTGAATISTTFRDIDHILIDSVSTEATIEVFAAATKS